MKDALFAVLDLNAELKDGKVE